jgi:hypothetical protein
MEHKFQDLSFGAGLVVQRFGLITFHQKNADKFPL